jgi:MFS transporter, DHA2 family, multidrug resistance protein
MIRPKIASALTGLPEAAKAAAEQSLAGAMAVGQQIGGTAGAGLVQAAKEAWMSGYQRSLLIGAVLVVVAAAIAYFGLPENAADHEESEIPEEGNFEVEEVLEEAA